MDIHILCVKMEPLTTLIRSLILGEYIIAVCTYIDQATAKYSGVCMHMVDAKKASKNRWTKYEIIVITDIR